MPSGKELPGAIALNCLKVVGILIYLIDCLCQGQIFRSQGHLEAPSPPASPTPIGSNSRGDHGPFHTPRGKIKIGPFSGLSEDQVDGSQRNARDRPDQPGIVMFDIFNLYAPIATIIQAFGQVLERLWEILEDLTLTLLNNVDPKLDHDDPQRSRVSKYFLSWSIIATVVILFAFCAKRYVLNPIFRRWDHEQEAQLSRLVVGSHSSVSPTTCLNNNGTVAKIATWTGGVSKRFPKCTIASSDSFSAARWTNQCLDNIFYVPTIRQRFLNAWLSALNQHCSLVAPQSPFRLEFTEISISQEPLLPRITVKRLHQNEMHVISDLEVASLLFGLRVYSMSHPEVAQASYVLGFEKLESSVKAIIQGPTRGSNSSSSSGGAAEAPSGRCQVAWATNPGVKLIPCSSINDPIAVSSVFPYERDICERIERTALEALICTDFQVQTSLLAMQDYQEEAQTHISPLLKSSHLSSDESDDSSVSKLLVSLVQASLAQSKNHSFYATVALDSPQQLLETLGDDLSQQESGRAHGKVAGPQLPWVNGNTRGSPAKGNAFWKAHTKFRQNFELLLDLENSKHLTIQLWRNIDDSILASYTFLIADLMFPSKQSHVVTLSKTDKDHPQPAASSNGNHSPGLEMEETSLKVKFQFLPASKADDSANLCQKIPSDPLSTQVSKTLVTKQVLGPTGRLHTSSSTLIYRSNFDTKSKSPNVPQLTSSLDSTHSEDKPEEEMDNLSKYQVAQVALTDLEKLRQNRGFIAERSVLQIRSVQRIDASSLGRNGSRMFEISSEDTSEKSLDVSTNGTEGTIGTSLGPGETKRRRRFISKIRRKFKRNYKSTHSSQDSSVGGKDGPSGSSYSQSPCLRRHYRGRQKKKSSSPGSKSAVIRSNSDIVSKSDTHSTKSSKLIGQESQSPEDNEEDGFDSDSSIEAEATLTCWNGPLSLSWQSLPGIKGTRLHIPSAVIEADASSLSEISAGSTSSVPFSGHGGGQGGDSILVLETLEPPGLTRHYLIPPLMVKKVRLKKKGVKLRIANKHVFATQKVKSGLMCDVCSQKIGKRMARKKAFVCRDCSLTTHKTCHTKTESDCSKSSLPRMELLRGSTLL